jgi:hypothetical protein
MIRVLKITGLVSAVLILNALTHLVLVLNAVPASAGPNCVNGDVNGDFVVDLSDPIHLLGYIFQGSPEPIACAQQPQIVPHFKLTGSPNQALPPQSPLGCGISAGVACEPYFIQFSTDEFSSGVLTAPFGNIVVQETGVYHIQFQLSLTMMNGGGEGTRLLILKNGMPVAEKIYHHDMVNRNQIEVSTLAPFNSGDLLEFSWAADYLGNISTPGDRELHSEGTTVYGYKVSD